MKLKVLLSKWISIYVQCLVIYVVIQLLSIAMFTAIIKFQASPHWLEYDGNCHIHSTLSTEMPSNHFCLRDVENFYCQYKAKLSMSNTRTWKYVKICKYLIITAYCHSHFDHYWDWVTMRCSCQSQAKQSKLPSLMRFSSRHFHFVPCFGWFCQKKNCWNYFFLAC